MPAPRRRVKPGWVLLGLVSVYAVVVSIAWRGAAADARAATRLEPERIAFATASSVPRAAAPPVTPSGAAVVGSLADPATLTPATPAPATPAPASSPVPTPTTPRPLWWPIPGGALPTDPSHLPGVAQDARGPREGFVIWPDTAGVPFGFGSPVIAVGDGTIVRVDRTYRELDVLTWERLNRSMEPSLLSEARDRLLGRQLWLELDDGRIVRYGHLSSFRDGIAVDRRIERGAVVAYVGNSGTLDAAAGRTSGARLHVEIREGEAFMGSGLSAAAVRDLARATFVGP